MQRLAEHSKVHGVGIDGRIFQIAQSKLQILNAIFFRFGFAETDNAFRIVDGDDLFRPAREQFAEQTFTGTEVGDDDGRNGAEEQLAERLPRTAWTIAAVETPGDLIEINL